MIRRKYWLNRLREAWSRRPIVWLAATRKFRDTLTGRRQTIHLHPVLWGESIEAFRAYYPEGENYIVSPSARASYRIRRGNLAYTVCSLDNESGWPYPLAL